MRHASLFSGIGGFDLAAEKLGWTNLFNCEINEFCRQVLDYHFPTSVGYEDIMKVDFTRWKGMVDVLSGGFPCQPFSVAGLQKGESDERYLWPEMLRAISECQPKWVVGENVLGLLSITESATVVSTNIEQDLFGGGYETTTERSEYVLHKIVGDLKKLGYDPIVFVIPACAVGAPHRRDRVWIVASREGENIPYDEDGKVVTEKSLQLAFKKPTTFWKTFPSFSPVCESNDGIPRELHNITFSNWRRESVKAYGNAIVPEIAETLFCIIQEIEKRK